MVSDHDELGLSCLLASSVGEGHPYGDRISEIIAGWHAGAEPDAAAVIDRDAEIASCKPACLELIYAEFAFRRERGEAVSSDAFLDRFPSLRRSLAELFSAIDFMKANLTDAVIVEEVLFRWPEVGEKVGPFRLVSHLGAGGLARVFLAREETAGNRVVVVKLSRITTPEQHIQGRLNHPNVMPILSANPDPKTGLTPICMPFLGRSTLQDLLDVRRNSTAEGHAAVTELLEACVRGMPEGVVPGAGSPKSSPDLSALIAHWGTQLAGALSHLHENDFVHGDLKPANVLVSGAGDARLIDFNLSTGLVNGVERRGGTLPYMAPEQWAALAQQRGTPPDPKADVFSLGVLLAELVLARHPFIQGRLDRPMRELASEFLTTYRERLPALRSQLTKASPKLSTIILACLSEVPEERPSAMEVEQALEVPLARRFSKLVAVCLSAMVLITMFLATVPMLPASDPDREPVSNHASVQDPFQYAQQLADQGRLEAACRVLEDHHEDQPLSGEWWAKLSYWCRHDHRKGQDYARLAILQGEDTPVTRTNAAYHAIRHFQTEKRIARLTVAERELGDVINAPVSPPDRILLAARYARMLAGVCRYGATGRADHQRERMAEDADFVLNHPALTADALCNVAYFYAIWADLAPKLNHAAQMAMRDRAQSRIALCYATAVARDPLAAQRMRADSTIASFLPEKTDQIPPLRLSGEEICLLDPAEFSEIP